MGNHELVEGSAIDLEIKTRYCSNCGDKFDIELEPFGYYGCNNCKTVGTIKIYRDPAFDGKIRIGGM